MRSAADGRRSSPLLSGLPAAVGGAGMLSLALLGASIVLLLLFAPPTAWDGRTHDARAAHQATQCIMVIRGELYPVTYLGDPRQNPDGTFYPGDAFYYLFTWQDRSSPGECGMRPPELRTEGLQLNHTGRLMGAADPLGGFARAGTAFTHSPQDSAVKLVKHRSYFGAEEVDRCRVHYAKPGESWSVPWAQYRLHGEPFLVKDDGSRLDRFEESKWDSKKGAGGATGLWLEKPRGHRGASGLPQCTFGPGGPGEGERQIPGHLSPYGYAEGSGTDMIFVSDAYSWGYRQSPDSAHPHQFDVMADPGTRDPFDARVAEACDNLGADSGCMYGTATITPHSGSCMYAEIERILGEDWLEEPDKDGDGIRDDEEEDGDGPPPLYLPPGIDAAQYAPPASDVCVPPDNVMLEAVLEGSYWAPQHRVQAGIEYPVRGVATAVADRSPPMSDPALNVLLTKPPLRHADGGYDARNGDGTYYHDDPVHIHHEPSWKWRDERYKHINFTIQRHHDVMPLEDDFHCAPGGSAGSPECSHTVSLDSPAWRNDTLWYGNGGGMSVYIGDASFDFGAYSYAFNMTAWNVDGEAAYSEFSTTDAELVPYEPVYDAVYSYPVLADAREYAFDDRRGIVVKYAGSLQDGQVHEGRRSFVNWWDATGGGHSPFGYAQFDREHVLSGGRSAPPGAEPPVLEYAPGGGAQAAMFTRAGYGVLHMEWPVSEHVFAELADGQNGTARGAKYANITAQSEFHSAGFAGHRSVPLFSDAMRYPEMPFAKQVLVRSIDQQGDVQWGDVITLRVAPYAGIAGDQAEAVEQWSGRQQGAGWVPWQSDLGGGGTDVNATAGNGTSPPPPPLLLLPPPAPADPLDLEGAEYLADYIRDKVMYDTGGDQIVTESVLNDTHGMVQEWTGRGQVDATVLRTSAYFADIAVQQQVNASRALPPDAAPGTPTPHEAADGGNGTGVDDRAGRPSSGANAGGAPRPPLRDLGGVLLGLADRPETLRLSAPLDVGLSVLPPTSVYVSVNGGEERAFHHKYYAFGGSEVISVNVRTDNALDVVRAGANGTTVIVRQPGNFGAMAGVELNGAKVGVPCAAGCTLSHMPANNTIRVTAYNEWGGEAHALVPPADAPLAAPAPGDPEWRVFAGAALVLVAGAYVSKKIFGKGMIGGGGDSR